MNNKQIKILARCIVLLALWGCVNQPPKSNVSRASVIKNEYRETDDILNYKYGIEDKIKKRMILSEIVQQYSVESDYIVDSITPVILISYEGMENGYEIYCIGRTDPWALEVSDITNLELLGRYIVAYSIPGDDTLSIQEIKQMGIVIDCPFLRVHETSWYTFLSPDLHPYFIVKNVFSKEESVAAFKEYQHRGEK